MKTLSLVIITFNRRADLLELLEDITRLENQDYLKEVVILNNASTESFNDIEKWIDLHNNIPFKYIVSEENLGVSRGRNYASKFATGDILFFVDDDVVLEDIFLFKKVIDSFSSPEFENRTLGAISFKVLYSSNRQIQINAFPHKNFEKLKGEKEFLTYYYIGCAHAMLREAWIKYGGYPSDFFYGMEEYDFSYWLIKNGYCIRYNSEVQLLHKESPLGRKPQEIKLRMMWVNKSKVAWKYLPRIYFYSTSIMWSIEFLRKTNFNLKHFFKAWKEIISIPRLEKREPINKNGLLYLRKVNARLWY